MGFTISTKIPAIEVLRNGVKFIFYIYMVFADTVFDLALDYCKSGCPFKPISDMYGSQGRYFIADFLGNHFSFHSYTTAISSIMSRLSEAIHHTVQE